MYRNRMIEAEEEGFEFTRDGVYKLSNQNRSHITTKGKDAGMTSELVKTRLRPSEEELLNDVKKDLIKQGLFKDVTADDDDTVDVKFKADGTAKVRADRNGREIFSKRY